MRFAWRGDHLEYEIYEQLGKLYIDHDKPRQGLNVLQRAAENTQSVPERREIVRMMAKAYKDVFLGEDFADLDPLLAVMVYDEFKELTPVGDEGDQLIDRLADKLMDINLYSRAVSVLQDKMERLGEGQHAIKTGLRIAATQLLDRQAQAARETLQKVDDMLSNYSGEDKDDMNQKVVLLKARALADTGDYNRALFMTEGLDDTADVLRLRIDTAWRAGEWVKVSDNLSKLLAGQNLTMAAPPTADQVQMILNQAVALNLSEQYDAVQRFAAKYDMIMKQSPAYKTFQIITRPRNLITLADRETLMNLTSEVDLFESFLTGAK